MHHKKFFKVVIIMVFFVSLAITGCVNESLPNIFSKETLSANSSPANNLTNALLKFMPENKNYMFSPLSIKIALAMAANGAEGDTQKEILTAFAIDDLDKYNAYVNELIVSLNNDKKVEFNLANSIWLNTNNCSNKDVKFSDTFNETIAKYYHGTAAEVDNKNAVETINNWISDNTHNKIRNVIDNPYFLSVLVNTIYFKGAWQDPFFEEDTIKKDFTDKNGQKKQTDFMNQTSYFDYYEDRKLQALSLPYVNPNIKMYIVLPKSTSPADTYDFDKIIANTKSKYVQLSLPKFKTEFDIELNDILQHFGIKTAFTDKAQFKNKMFVNEIHPVIIDKVIHKTYIDVNEKGTEAAAATAIIAVLGGCPQKPPKPITFEVNHPFLYFIYDCSHNEILFVGEYGFVE